MKWPDVGVVTAAEMAVTGNDEKTVVSRPSKAAVYLVMAMVSAG